ncbi:MAG TPA: Fe-S cluster assembly protein SufD [Acetobacteraceae bacterium]|nr:Fe-S cluster assembly protein SufD [Acetobacteraceae bacterium]
MTVVEPVGEAGFLARYEGLKDRLPGDAAVRAAAAESFRRIGLPGRRDEAWKYTNLRPLAEAAFHEPLSPVADGQTLETVPWLAPERLVFIDGRYRADLSDPPEGFAHFAERPLFGTGADAMHHPMVALNTMLAEDGVVIDVPAERDAGTLHLASLATPAPGRMVGFHPRHVVRLGRGARLTLVETAQGEGAYLHNAVFALRLERGASLSLVRLQGEAPAAFHFSTTLAEIEAGAHVESFVLALGARLARTEIHTRLTGPDATVHLGAAQLLAGAQLADVTTVVRHEAPRCASRQAVKNVLTGRSRGVFQGRIEVARAAQKTDGYQMSQALLLSPDAEVDTKPELEIFADDVKCSHGATVGELDPDQLFYLRTRGVPEPEARAILVRAFLAEALEAVASEPARHAMEEAVEQWWKRQAA